MSGGASERPYKVCLLGEGRVGKTSILLRFVRGAFDDRQTSTISASCFDKRVPIGGGEQVRVSLWDTAGQERFHALGPLYYRDADGALLVYDITDEQSFLRVKEWVKELRKMLGEDIVIAIAGNKVDMEKQRNVDKDAALQYTASVGGSHHLTSAKSGAGINEAFSELLKRVVARKRKSAQAGAGGKDAAARPNLKIVEDDEKGEAPKKGGCC
jgi:Ras-related protein Rab-21